MNFYIIFTLSTMSQSHFITKQSLLWTNPLTTKKEIPWLDAGHYLSSRKNSQVSFNPELVYLTLYP